MIKNFFCSLFLLFSLLTFAQQGTSSPYSFYGIGDVRFKGTNENRALGGLSFVPDSIHINIQNPALLSSLKLTAFSVGGTFSPVKLKTTTQNEKAQRTSLDYLAIAIPVNKFNVGFGLIPFSSVGYFVRNSNSNLLQNNRFEGNGGINRVYTTLSYKINSSFSVGADLQYNFGTIETKKVTLQDDVQLGTREINTSGINGLSMNFGLSYAKKINNKFNLYSGLTFAPQANLTLNNERVIATVQALPGGEVEYGDPFNVPLSDTKLKLPSKLSLGSGIGNLKKWFVGAEVTHQNNSDFGNRFADIDNVTFQNATKVSLGGFFIPKFNAFSQYWKKITYRGGLRYENTGLVVNNQSIKDAAATVGFGFPIGNSFSNVNIGAEFGQRGTTKAGLIQENYTNISIGISFNDRWFIKRKYD
jgi:long-subunit fatty acid transport protein